MYHHQGSSWIHNLQREELKQSMDNFSKLVISKKRKNLQPFLEYVLGEYDKGVDKYGNQIEESSREEPFERRWNRARAILLNRK